MDTMFFYFEIYDIRCRKHSTHKRSELDKEKKIIESWRRELEELFDALNAPIEKYPNAKLTSEKVKRMLAPSEIEEFIVGVVIAQ